MEFNNRSYYEMNHLLREYGAPKTSWSSRIGLKRSRKWKDQKGPNPLMMMGLDRS
ncbi:MAG: hypothetical protein AAGA50_11740 [Pseudomonadota bacterium]|jgi:hypothetical protein